MWLLPVFSPVANLALRVFYRFAITGKRVPEEGPVLLVANHPNSLLDPASVVAAAGRPVRFLAKSPLFTDKQVGWLIRGAGAIPVYRKQDDPAETAKNDDTFRAVHEALAEGAAVGIFPEGTSHSEPSLVPLKTGAARIALGAAPLVGGAFPIVPVGLSFRRKETFRSEATVFIGRPVAWDDLAGRGEADFEAARELTRRIDAALHDVTVNLERWEDAPLVETAEAVFAVETGADPSPAARLVRLRETAEGLARLRAEERGEWREVARDVAGHARVLKVLGMSPEQVKGGNRTSVAAEWLLRQLVFFGIGAPVALLGLLVYALPYRATGMAEALARPPRDVRATTKLLFGGALHVVWTLVLAGVVTWRFGWIAGLATLLALPLAGFVTLHVVERWTRAVGEARRFFLRARRQGAVREVRARQKDLGRRLQALWETVRT